LITVTKTSGTQSGTSAGMSAKKGGVIIAFYGRGNFDRKT
jgi:hypothetical protein